VLQSLQQSAPSPSAPGFRLQPGELLQRIDRSIGV
jgi:hypothetical protein